LSTGKEGCPVEQVAKSPDRDGNNRFRSFFPVRIIVPFIQPRTPHTVLQVLGTVNAYLLCLAVLAEYCIKGVPRLCMCQNSRGRRRTAVPPQGTMIANSLSPHAAGLNRVICWQNQIAGTTHSPVQPPTIHVLAAPFHPDHMAYAQSRKFPCPCSRQCILYPSRPGHEGCICLSPTTTYTKLLRFRQTLRHVCHAPYCTPVVEVSPVGYQPPTTRTDRSIHVVKVYK